MMEKENGFFSLVPLKTGIASSVALMRAIGESQVKAPKFYKGWRIQLVSGR